MNPSTQQKKRFRVFGFVTPRTLVAVLLCAAACSILTGTLLGFFHPGPPAKISQRTLTFAERVTYQRAIEDVYWRHRIWPKERTDSKPSLDAVMSQAQLGKKVADYMRESQTLEHYWQRLITLGSSKPRWNLRSSQVVQQATTRRSFVV